MGETFPDQPQMPESNIKFELHQLVVDQSEEAINALSAIGESESAAQSSRGLQTIAESVDNSLQIARRMRQACQDRSIAQDPRKALSMSSQLEVCADSYRSGFGRVGPGLEDKKRSATKANESLMHIADGTSRAIKQLSEPDNEPQDQAEAVPTVELKDTLIALGTKYVALGAGVDDVRLSILRNNGSMEDLPRPGMIGEAVATVQTLARKIESNPRAMNMLEDELNTLIRRLNVAEQKVSDVRRRDVHAVQAAHAVSTDFRRLQTALL